MAFKNIELGKHLTGNGKDAQLLAEIMSSVWINFAKNGDPKVINVLSEWDIYTKENGETIIFEIDCKVVNKHARELMNLVMSID